MRLGRRMVYDRAMKKLDYRTLQNRADEKAGRGAGLCGSLFLQICIARRSVPTMKNSCQLWSGRGRMQCSAAVI